MQEFSRTWKCLTWTQISWSPCPPQWENWQSSRSWIFRTTILRLTFSTWLISQVFSLISFPFLFPLQHYWDQSFPFFPDALPASIQVQLVNPSFLQRQSPNHQMVLICLRKTWTTFQKILVSIFNWFFCFPTIAVRINPVANLGRRVDLTSLDVSKNMLKVLPDSIKSLQKLKNFKFVRKWSLFGYLFHLRNWRFFISFFFLFFFQFWLHSSL